MPMTRDEFYNFQISRGRSDVDAARIADTYAKDNAPPTGPSMPRGNPIVVAGNSDPYTQAIASQTKEGQREADQLFEQRERQRHVDHNAAYQARLVRQAEEDARNERARNALTAIPALSRNAGDAEKVARARLVEAALREVYGAR